MKNLAIKNLIFLVCGMIMGILLTRAMLIWSPKYNDGQPLTIEYLRDGKMYHKIDYSKVSDWGIFFLEEDHTRRVYELNLGNLPKVFIFKKIGEGYKIIPVDQNLIE